MLGAAGDLGANADRLQFLRQIGTGLVDVLLAILTMLCDQCLDLVVFARMQRLEGEVLEFPLDPMDTEAVCDRRVDIERLTRLVDLLLLRHRLDRAHVVQPVGELDQDDPDVRGHRDHHLAVVLCLRLVARLEGQLGQLRDAVDETGDLLAESLIDVGDRGMCVLNGVVQQRRAQRLGVQAHAGADLGDADRVDDELLAGAASLIGMVAAGVDERVAHAVAVDGNRGLVGMFLDHRKEIVQQPLLEVVQNHGLSGRCDAVGSSVQRSHVAVASGAHVADLGFAALRNRWPSSLVCV